MAPEQYQGKNGIASEAKRREVLQLLKEYQAWHAAFGGAMALDETGVVDASYGPAGYIEVGQQYPRRERARLKQSYEDLEHAITLLKAAGTEGFVCWLMLLSPYLGDPGDPDLVRLWRERGDRRVEWHDLAIEKLAGYLRGRDLYVLWPQRRSVREEQALEKRNSQMVAEYRDLVAGGMKRGKAKQTVADWNGGLSLRRVEQILELHEA